MQPKLPTILESLSLEDFLEDDAEAGQLVGADLTSQSINALDLSGVLIDSCQFGQTSLSRISARDIRLERSDFSMASLANGAINRAECRNCRMTGTDFSKTTLHDVVFIGCKLDMANFRFSDMRRVKFVDCSMVETDFLGATLHDVTFESCSLERTVFDQAKCKLVDLRSSDLQSVSGWSSLRGAVIDSGQLAMAAPYLAQQLGLKVSDS